MSTRFYAVDRVFLTLEKSNPPNLLITAKGRVSTPLWSNPVLVAHHHISPPADAVQEFECIATPPPKGTALIQKLTEISSSTILPAVDIDNYWGEGQPLKGVRCLGQSNAKTALMEAQMGMPAAEEIGGGQNSISFAAHIRPLFRRIDIDRMIAVRNLDLGSYDTVASYADLILSRLEDGSMPFDGPWPPSDIALFSDWIARGKLR